MRLSMAFVLGLGGALAWRDSTLAKSRVGIFFFFFLVPASRDVQGEQQASLGNEHGDLVEATAAWLGTQKDPERKGCWGPRASVWGLCKNKELKKKIRGEATQSRREDRRLWDVV